MMYIYVNIDDEISIESVKLEMYVYTVYIPHCRLKFFEP